MPLSNQQLRDNVKTFHMAELYLVLDHINHYNLNLHYKLVDKIYKQFSLLTTSAGQDKARMMLCEDTTRFLLCYKHTSNINRSMLSKKDALKLGNNIGKQSLKLWNN